MGFLIGRIAALRCEKLFCLLVQGSPMPAGEFQLFGKIFVCEMGRELCWYQQRGGAQLEKSKNH